MNDRFKIYTIKCDTFIQSLTSIDIILVEPGRKAGWGRGIIPHLFPRMITQERPFWQGYLALLYSKSRHLISHTITYRDKA